MTSQPAVTLFIPTWNAGPEFPQILDRLRHQRLDRPYEILIIDSGSTDGTAEFLRNQPVRLIEIPNAEFNHGRTRMRGILESRSDIIVLTVQDACPVDESWLQPLVDAFADEAVAGAYSRQVPKGEASPFVRERVQGGTAAHETPRVQSVASPEAFERLAPIEKAQRATFDNVSSAVRRRAVLEVPFGERRFGEDLDWGRRILLAGYKIAYVPRSCVIHSHDRSPWYELKRVYLDSQIKCLLFGVRIVPRRRDVIWRTIAGARYGLRTVARDRSLAFAARLNWGARAIPYSFGQSLALYLGARSAARLPAGSLVYRWIDRALGHGV